MLTMNNFRLSLQYDSFFEDNGFVVSGHDGEAIRLKLRTGWWTGFAEDAAWYFHSLAEAFGFARGLVDGVTVYSKCRQKRPRKKR